MSHHRVLCTLCALGIFGCTGELQNSSSDDPTPDMSTVTRPDADTPRGDMTVSLPDQGMTATASLQVTHRGAPLSPGQSVALGNPGIGALPTCETFTLSNTGDASLALGTSLSGDDLFFTQGELPESLEAMTATPIEVCVRPERAGVALATLTITPRFTLELTSRIEPASPMLATGPGALRRSEDRGETWSMLPIPEGLELVHGAVWEDQKFWLFGEGTKPLWQSADGATWEPVEVPAEITGITAIARGEQGNFMGVHEQAIVYSPDGVTWTHVAQSVPDDETLLDITWFKGQFVAVGDSITALSDDGQTWSERRGWETPMTRIISHGEYVVRVRETNVQISEDAREWRSDYTFCRDTQAPPSAPVLSPEGVMLSKCSGILKASGSKFSWRQVGTGTQMPTPLLHAHGLFHGIDEQGEFVWSQTGLEWTRAEGDASGITRMVSASTPSPAPAPPEQPACAHDALACVDFEQEVTGLPPVFAYGLRAGTANVVAIDSEFAFSGDKSMRIDAFAEQEGQGGMISLQKEDFPAALEDKIYGRMMFYTTAYPVRNWHMSESSGLLASADNTRVQYNAGGDHERAFHNYYGNGSDCWNKSEVAYPVNQWFCWQVEYDRAANTMVISIDGQEAHRMDGTGDGCLGGQGAQTIWQAPAAFEGFNIGYRPFKKQEQDMTTWIDDVAISDKSIPCPEP